MGSHDMEQQNNMLDKEHQEVLTKGFTKWRKKNYPKEDSWTGIKALAIVLGLIFSITSFWVFPSSAFYILSGWVIMSIILIVSIVLRVRKLTNDFLMEKAKEILRDNFNE